MVLTYTIDDTDWARISAAFAAIYAYNPGSGTPQDTFVKRRIMSAVQDLTKNYEHRQAVLVATRTAEAIPAVDMHPVVAG